MKSGSGDEARETEGNKAARPWLAEKQARARIRTRARACEEKTKQREWKRMQAFIQKVVRSAVNRRSTEWRVTQEAESTRPRKKRGEGLGKKGAHI